jgi:3-oxoacyl-[acyl-carrier-protein] synthase-3
VTALLDVACHLPEQRLDVADVCAGMGADPQLLWTFRRLYGLRSVRRAPGRDHRSLLAAAVAALTELHGNESRVRYVMLARTLGPVAPAGEYPVEELCAELGLANAVGFTLSQHACAAGLVAMDLAGRLLTADGDPEALALVLTGEKVVTPAAQAIPESTVMGEGTAACLVGPSGERDRLLGFATRTLGRYAEQVPPRALDPEFVKEHNEILAEVILQACRQAGVAVDDLALILPHNVNRLSWTWAARLLGIPPDRIFLDNIPVTGHCFGADPFINHVDARAAGRLQPGDLYLMASVGLGATFSAAVLRH